MKKQVNPIVATVLILCTIVFAGYVIWKLNEDKPIPEGPGIGRIGQTFTLSAKPSHKPGSAGKPGTPAETNQKKGQ